jgi:hypothetical protein
LVEVAQLSAVARWYLRKFSMQKRSITNENEALTCGRDEMERSKDRRDFGLCPCKLLRRTAQPFPIGLVFADPHPPPGRGGHFFTGCLPGWPRAIPIETMGEIESPMVEHPGSLRAEQASGRAHV